MNNGNSLGPRRYFRYDSDTGESFKYLTDRDLGDAVGAELSASLPDLPRRFKPRVLFVETVDRNPKLRKALVIPESDNSLYATNNSVNILIDGVVFASTGRRGEQVSFGANPSEAPALPPGG